MLFDDDERADENSDIRSHCKMIVLRLLFFIFESHSSQVLLTCFRKDPDHNHDGCSTEEETLSSCASSIASTSLTYKTLKIN